MKNDKIDMLLGLALICMGVAFACLMYLLINRSHNSEFNPNCANLHKAQMELDSAIKEIQQVNHNLESLNAKLRLQNKHDQLFLDSIKTVTKSLNP